MRLFVALEIPSAVRDNLATLIQELRAVASQPKWVRPENLHITVKFIGEVAPPKLEAIRETLSEVRSDRPVELSFRGVGFFPSERRPRVFWVGMKASPNLAVVANEIDERLSTLSIPRETRAFTPHLTLARFELPGISEKLRSAIGQDITREFGTLRTGEFHLIQSKLKPTGAEYTALHSFPFAVEA